MVDCGRDECQKKKNRLIAGYFWSIWSGSLRQGERQKPWMETRRTLTMSRVAPLKKNAKKTFTAEWGAGVVSPLGLILVFGPLPQIYHCSIEVTLRQHLIKKKKNSPLSFSNFLELFSRRPRIVFKLDNILWETKHTTQPIPNVKLLAVSYRLLQQWHSIFQRGWGGLT